MIVCSEPSLSSNSTVPLGEILTSRSCKHHKHKESRELSFGRGGRRSGYGNQIDWVALCLTACMDECMYVSMYVLAL